MTVSAFDTLVGISEFLAKEVVPVVPKEMSSEVRAISKLLLNVADELDWLPAALRTESEELLALHRSAQRFLRRRGYPIAVIEEPTIAPLGSVRALLDTHREISARTAATVLKLQARIRAMPEKAEDAAVSRAFLDRYYETLGRHAETRLRWQSVFAEKQSAATAADIRGLNSESK